MTGHPFDTVKVRLQASAPGLYTGPLDAIRSLVKQEGLLSLYKGVIPVLIGCQLSHATVYSSYQYFRRLLDPEFQYLGSGARGSKPNFRSFAVDVAVAGCLSGLVTSVVLNPVEIVKIRLQMDRIGRARHEGALGRVVRDVARMQMFGTGFFRGLPLTAAREMVRNYTWFCFLFCLGRCRPNLWMVGWWSGMVCRL
jgi:hypothetical protein